MKTGLKEKKKKESSTLANKQENKVFRCYINLEKGKQLLAEKSGRE